MSEQLPSQYEAHQIEPTGMARSLDYQPGGKHGAPSQASLNVLRDNNFNEYVHPDYPFTVDNGDGSKSAATLGQVMGRNGSSLKLSPGVSEHTAQTGGAFTKNVEYTVTKSANDGSGYVVSERTYIATKGKKHPRVTSREFSMNERDAQAFIVAHESGDKTAEPYDSKAKAAEAAASARQAAADAGRLPVSDELLEQAHAENEGFDIYNSGQAHAENEGFDIYNSGQAHQENANFDINKVYDQAHAENERLDNFLREFSPGAHTGRTGLSEALNEALKEYVRVHAGLGEALNEYARISAEQRNGHHGRVEGSRLKAFLHGLSKKRSDAMDAAVNEQRVWYKQRLDGMANLVRELYGIKGKDANFTGSNELFTHAKVLQLRANQLVELEGAIFDYRATQAIESRFAGLNNFLAKSWHGHGKVRRTLVVAALPFAAGAAIGLAASALPAAASIALGAGVAYGGRKLGQEHARRVNKSTVHQLAKEAVVGQAARSAAATVQSELARRPESDINSNIDFTTITEAVTTAEVKQNQGRRSKIGRIAAVAAGLGYGAGKITGNLLSADHNTVPTKQTGTGAGHGGQPGLVSPPAEATPTYGDGFSTNNLPWNVANHYVGPNEAMDTVSRAVDVINQQTGAGYSLHNVAGNVQVYLDGHALNPAAQAHFNDMMVQLLKLQ